MGLMGRYIDALPLEARDRLIEAQQWCVAELLGPGGSRCLIGHAEDWLPLEVGHLTWRWTDDETGAVAGEQGDPLAAACSPQLFAFRRARPADLGVYRERIARWGLASEARIGCRFDRLCVRRGAAGAVRLIKRRAARDFRPDALLRPTAALAATG